MRLHEPVAAATRHYTAHQDLSTRENRGRVAPGLIRCQFIYMRLVRCQFIYICGWKSERTRMALPVPPGRWQELEGEARNPGASFALLGSARATRPPTPRVTGERDLPAKTLGTALNCSGVSPSRNLGHTPRSRSYRQSSKSRTLLGIASGTQSMPWPVPPSRRSGRKTGCPGFTRFRMMS